MRQLEVGARSVAEQLCCDTPPSNYGSPTNMSNANGNPGSGLPPVKLQRPLLGFAGFLQFFTATFHGDREEVELTVNSLYAGT